MSRIALLLICVAILFQSFQRTWIVASWKMNQSYIAANLCEQRKVENSCCVGSCYLDKQLKENEAQEESKPFNEKLKSELVCNVFSFSYGLTDLVDIFSERFPISWKEGLIVDRSSRIFHPPSV
jgi:hypothetical protein